MRAFPSVEVLGIATRDHITKDAPTVLEIGEEVSEAITPEFIERRLEKRQDLVYTLHIHGTTERSAMIKGRLFVRAKNPFEPSFINVTDVEKIESKGVMNKYQLLVGVGK